MGIRNSLKMLIRKLVLGYRADSDSYLKYLKDKGARIGERVFVYSPMHVGIDMTRPWLIDIGNDVQITRGVTILTHGYDWSVIKGVYGEVLGSSGKVTIGNNVFIGMNSLILKGSKIGNNVIIGAGSIVTRDIPDNCVAVGNPAKVICSLDEYRKKRLNAQLDEAQELVKEYRLVYHREPGPAELGEFFWLFEDNPIGLPKEWDERMNLLSNREYSNKKFIDHKKKFNSMQDFLRKCKD